MTSEGQNNTPTSSSYISGGKPDNTAHTLDISDTNKLMVDSSTDSEENIKESIINAEPSA